MDVKEGVARLIRAAEKLLSEVSRLQHDVSVLNGRIEKYEDEIVSSWRPTPRPQTTWNIVDALNMIESARVGIRNCEYDLSAIRGRIDAIEKDAISREEMKPWIKSTSR